MGDFATTAWASAILVAQQKEREAIAKNHLLLEAKDEQKLEQARRQFLLSHGMAWASLGVSLLPFSRGKKYAWAGLVASSALTLNTSARIARNLAEVDASILHRGQERQRYRLDDYDA